MLVIVIRITPPIRNELSLTTGNALQKRRIWTPIKLLRARDGHAPLVLVSLWQKKTNQKRLSSAVNSIDFLQFSVEAS